MYLAYSAIVSTKDLEAEHGSSLVTIVLTPRPNGGVLAANILAFDKISGNALRRIPTYGERFRICSRDHVSMHT